MQVLNEIAAVKSDTRVEHIMTFCIDIVTRDQRNDNLGWHFEIKGLRGRGIYCDLKTDNTGHGLWVIEECPDKYVQLLSTDDFEIPETATRWHARKKLAMALIALAWGPEVHD
jgi:Fe-S-cluster-containing hydrogenase component 2